MSSPMEAITDEKVAYRWLPKEEYYKLAELLKDLHGTMPIPMLSEIAIAEVGDEIIGFHVYQLQPHAEPAWVKPEYRGTRVWTRLGIMIAPLIELRKCYVIATNPAVAHICRKLGFREITVPVFVYDEKEGDGRR